MRRHAANMPFVVAIAVAVSPSRALTACVGKCPASALMKSGGVCGLFWSVVDGSASTNTSGPEVLLGEFADLPLKLIGLLSLLVEDLVNYVVPTVGEAQEDGLPPVRSIVGEIEGTFSRNGDFVLPFDVAGSSDDLFAPKGGDSDGVKRISCTV
jgi:hypothetical protein